MKLKTFSIQSAPKVRLKKPTIRVNGKSGLISLNGTAARAIRKRAKELLEEEYKKAAATDNL